MAVNSKLMTNFGLRCGLSSRKNRNTVSRSPSARCWAAVAVLLTLVAGLPHGVAAATPGSVNNRIKLDPQFHAPGCEPLPSIPTVGRWFARITLDYEELAATSADCGLVGGADGPPGAGQLASAKDQRKGTANGWTYILWSEETAVAGALRKVGEALGVTRLLLKKPEDSHAVHATGEGAFFLVQLDGDEAKPARIWAAGDVKSLTGSLSLRSDESVGLRLESVDYGGGRCAPPEIELRKDRADGETVELPCS